MADLSKRNQGVRDAYAHATAQNLTSLLYKHKNSNRCSNCRYDGDCPVVEKLTKKLQDLQLQRKESRLAE